MAHRTVGHNRHGDRSSTEKCRSLGHCWKRREESGAETEAAEAEKQSDPFQPSVSHPCRFWAASPAGAELDRNRKRFPVAWREDRVRCTSRLTRPPPHASFHGRLRILAGYEASSQPGCCELDVAESRRCHDQLQVLLHPPPVAQPWSKPWTERRGRGDMLAPFVDVGWRPRSA